MFRTTLIWHQGIQVRDLRGKHLLAPFWVEDLTAELGHVIQEKHTKVDERQFARPRHVARADQPHIGDGVIGARETAGLGPMPRCRS
jgi:hypothetical protein